MKLLNILLLGKSGVGKSTFINSFANYVSYDSVDRIQDRNSILVPIPCSFTLYDDEGNLKEFKMGEELNSDKNESMNPLESGTQGCKAYRFDFQDLRVCLIDTPGIVDTDGIEKDQKNLEDILNFLSLFPSIDGICILLKPDEERLDAVFRYCILELLSQLDISAAQNIVFGFTKARGSLYRPGASGRAIVELLQEINANKPDLNLKFSKQNYFCFDSEAFRFLISRDDIEFEADEINTFKDSWNKSRKECVRMIKYIAGLPEHDVQNTVAIIKARKIIECLLLPLVDISDNIMRNQELCKEREISIIAAKDDLSKLESELYIPKSNITMEYYNSPRLLCGSKNCTQVTKIGEKEETHYKTVCLQLDETFQRSLEVGASTGVHMALTKQMVDSMKSPKLSSVVKVVGGIAVAGVAAAVYYYWKNGGMCVNCECPIVDHFISYYETREEVISIMDESTKLKIDDEEDALNLSQVYLRSLKLEQQELKMESDCINNASSTFALFLHSRAIANFNDATESYLNYLIEANKKAKGKDEECAKKLQRLEMQKHKYQCAKAAIEKGSRKDGLTEETIKPDHIDKIVLQLCNLQRYGHMIKESLEKNQDMRVRDNKARIISLSVQTIFDSFFE